MGIYVHISLARLAAAPTVVVLRKYHLAEVEAFPLRTGKDCCKHLLLYALGGLCMEEDVAKRSLPPYMHFGLHKNLQLACIAKCTRLVHTDNIQAHVGSWLASSKL